jgi:hypothetical protein
LAVATRDIEASSTAFSKISFSLKGFWFTLPWLYPAQINDKKITLQYDNPNRRGTYLYD